MAEKSDRLVLTVDWPEITIRRLSQLSAVWAEIVQGVTTETAGSATAVKWVIQNISLQSPLRVEAVPKKVARQLDTAVLHQIGGNVVDGIEHLQKFSDRPPLFSDLVLLKVRRLALFSDEQKGRSISVSNGADLAARIGSRVAANVDDLFGPIRESYGSVEGTLEGVFIHGSRRFFVYDSLTGRQIKCDFGNRVPLPDVLGAFGRRVSASGVLRSRAKTGERVSAQVHHLRVFKSDSDLTPTDRIQEAWQRL